MSGIPTPVMAKYINYLINFISMLEKKDSILRYGVSLTERGVCLGWMLLFIISVSSDSFGEGPLVIPLYCHLGILVLFLTIFKTNLTLSEPIYE